MKATLTGSGWSDRMPTPLWEALVRHVAARPVPWHVPGHKMGRGAPPDLIRWLGAGLKLDLTELPGLDDLHQPEGPIAEAQVLVAQTFGADESFFLVGGSTVGNIAMLLATCEPGETVLIARNVHRSVISGLMLAGASALVVAPDWEYDLGVPGGIRVETVARILGAHPEIRTVLVTSPTYHGVCSDLASLAEEVHRRGGLLLVDEAHGGHFPFVQGSPPGALASGADAVVQSWHKTMGSLTQSAVLHLRGNRVDRQRIRESLATVQSSSPSYLLMASLDLARQWMQDEGGRRLDSVVQTLAQVREELDAVPGVDVLTAERARRAGGVGLDPARLTLGVVGSRGTGIEWGEALRRRGIWPELEEPTAVTFVAGPGDDSRIIGRLVKGLQDVAMEIGGGGEPAEGRRGSRVFPGTEAAEWAALLQELWHNEEGQDLIRPRLARKVRWVPLGKALGLQAARAVIPYPPGIPMLLPGERIRPLHNELIRMGRSMGVRLVGMPSDEEVVAVTEEGRE
ncbi:arginine decarboxylase [Kyrpidia spormannii]|uniref:Arginine decarboxylase n=2 Tax=Kyrpidia spormannii TaxID=2055160 RepID=A0A2K8N4W2_9BACL|nr:arginine decarboxylase [Kyrpidia spormannii]